MDQQAIINALKAEVYDAEKVNQAQRTYISELANILGADTYDDLRNKVMELSKHLKVEEEPETEKPAE